MLLHDAGGDRSQTVAALNRLIPELKRQGYQFSTIADALILPSANPPATHLGDNNDVSQFATVIAELARRHRRIGGDTGELTVVFDAGQNSEANFADLTGQGLHYVGSVPPSDQPDLLAIPRWRYQPIDQFEGLHATEVSLTALGHTHRGVLTHSAELHAGQSRGLTQALAKVDRDLTHIADTLARGRARRTRAQLEATLDKIVNKQYVREVATYTLTGDTPTTFRLNQTIDTQARTALEEKIFSKRILITDRHDWTTGDIIAAYRSQSDAEFGFRQMKDPHVVSFSPMHHFTDAHIRVHVFYCVLALTILERVRGMVMLNTVGMATTVVGVLQWVLIATGVLVVARLLLMLVVARRHSRQRGSRDWSWGPPVTESVSVIVPAYNEKECIADTVRSLVASDYPIEIIVVDDGSTDGTADIAESLGFPHVTVIRKTNGGKASALNTGTLHARNNLIVMIDRW